MKFRAERDGFLEALTTASRAATIRGAGSSGAPTIFLRLSGSRLEVAGSDPDLVIESEIEVAGEADGATTAPARLIVDIVRSFEPGAVSFVADEDEVRLASGQAEFQIRVPHGADLVRLGVLEGHGIELPADTFGEALRQVVRAALADDSRAPQLTGVLMIATDDGVRLVATDGYRLAVRDLAGLGALQPGESVLVPARALTEVQRLLGGGGSAEARLVFRHSDLDASFETSGVRLTTRLLKGTFPDYERLIPDEFSATVSVSREELATALRRVRLLVRDSKDATTPVRLTFGSDALELNVMTAESGRALERVQAKYSGDEVTVAFNPTYLLEGVEAIRADVVIIEVIDSTKPALVHGDGEDEYRYILMPVRVS